MLLAFSTWPEIEQWLARNTTVVVPIGSNEQHGPTGLLGTDWLCPEIIAHEAHRQGGDVLVAPTFNIGMAQHHLGFPGTISLRPSTFQAAICDWVESLSRHGFQRIYFLNGHGGNIASIEAAFSEAYAKYSFAARECPFMLKLRSWWQLRGRAGWPTTCSHRGTARTRLPPKSPSPRAPIRTPSNGWFAVRQPRPRDRCATRSTFAPGFPTAGWAPILCRRPRRKAPG